MSNFKKVLFSSIIFLVIISLFSSFALIVYSDSESDYYLDRKVRNSLSGTLDCIIIGSSNGMCGFDCSVLDNALNCNSYNMCGNLMSPNGKYYLLNNELKRNKVKLVIMEVSFEDLHYNTREKKSEGEIYLIPRINGYANQAYYFIKNVHLKDFFSVYSTLMNYSYEFFLSKLTGSYQSKINCKDKGQYKKPYTNIFLNKEKIYNLKQSNKIGQSYVEENVRKIVNLINLCHDNNAEVILVTTPFSDSQIWTYSDWEYYSDLFSKIAINNKCTYIDSNLIKKRTAELSDKCSFADEEHLSEYGAQQFSLLFCEVLKKINSGEDVSDMFYPSYDEAIKHFEYYEIYQSMLKEQS